jgi:hypothetical protein
VNNALARKIDVDKGKNECDSGNEEATIAHAEENGDVTDIYRSYTPERGARCCSQEQLSF